MQQHQSGHGLLVQKPKAKPRPVRMKTKRGGGATAAELATQSFLPAETPRAPTEAAAEPADKAPASPAPGPVVEEEAKPASTAAVRVGRLVPARRPRAGRQVGGRKRQKRSKVRHHCSLRCPQRSGHMPARCARPSEPFASQSTLVRTGEGCTCTAQRQ